MYVGSAWDRIVALTTATCIPHPGRPPRPATCTVSVAELPSVSPAHGVPASNLVSHTRCGAIGWNVTPDASEVSLPLPNHPPTSTTMLIDPDALKMHTCPVVGSTGLIT